MGEKLLAHPVQAQTLCVDLTPRGDQHAQTDRVKLHVQPTSIGGARINQDPPAERSLNQCSSALTASIASLSRDFSMKALPYARDASFSNKTEQQKFNYLLRMSQSMSRILLSRIILPYMYDRRKISSLS
ncbi:hypothetical protein K0M31_013452 [Melipona bicolor]|uniref:Uncharacterized protein n=1 Tax=Melipona bicolor TaxID=60889 RepID=A0AA40FHM9_9HYME|nr:hypothetical protein K0M31_013452 [Melipona bicolor]